MSRSSDSTEAATGSGLSSSQLHDLRTPLNQIIGYSELLREQADEGASAEMAADLGKISQAGHHMLALLAQVALASDEASTSGDSATAPATGPSKGTSVGRTAPEDGPAVILVVDDNEMNRDVLARRLERQGYVVAKASDGAEAMTIAREREFDLVLLDVMMPVMDGYEALRQLKADETLRDIPVIMISALDEMDSVVRCIEMGAEDYLPKPFNATLLKARTSASIEKKRARDRERRLFAQVQESFERLQMLEKQRDDLTHMIVHDLRTPLTSMMMGMQTMEIMGDLNPDQRESMGIAMSGSETLLGMINGLLDVTKMESGSMTLDLGTVHPAEIVADAVSQIAKLAEQNHLGLVQEIAADVPPFEGDPNLLRRTLVNLVGNAIKFTPPEGTVTIDVRTGGNRVVFSVIDTGEGMPPEAASYIFEKFGQVGSRKGGRTMSTGLGLTFCRLAVEAHGGEIGVESTLGVGSTFSFWIPLNAERSLL